MLTIVIQAGGRSSRMGQDKALMPFLGRPLIARMLARLENLPGERLVITNRPEAYAFLGVRRVGDALPGAGPLGGLYTALMAAETAMVAGLACDLPLISAGLIASQWALLEQEGVDVVIPRSPEGLEPLHAIYRRETCLPAVQAALEAGERKMIAWLPAVRARVMEADEVAQHDPAFHSFLNVNSPEEFGRAEALARLED
jgi:molybdopterin-guanine dinucleotide biosynthesis protein A